jgi:hypothetical protein
MPEICRFLGIVIAMYYNEHYPPHYVTKVVYLDGYRLKVWFEDGSSKVVDLQPYLEGPIFEPLKNFDFFRKVTLNPDIDTIVWPNNADFAPEFLHEIGNE